MKPKGLEDYEILKQRKLNDLKISSILKSHVTSYLDKWLSINDQEDYTGDIYFTIRALYTVIKNQEAPISLSTQDFIGGKLDPNAKAPRYDKLIQQFKAKKAIYKTSDETNNLGYNAAEMNKTLQGFTNTYETLNVELDEKE